MATELETVEMVVKGRVQGVGFRYFTYKAAVALGIRGWVKNTPDGDVLLRAAGSHESMAAFRKKLWKGPTFGRVDDLLEKPLAPDALARLSDFQITF